MPALVHGLWDSSLVSSAVVPGERYPGPGVAIRVMVVLAVVVVLRRHRIEPGSGPSAPAATAP